MASCRPFKRLLLWWNSLVETSMGTKKNAFVFCFIPLNLIVLILTLMSMNKSGAPELNVKVRIFFLKCFLKLWVGLCLIAFCFSFIPKVFCSLLISFAKITIGGGEGKDWPTTDLKQCNSVSLGKPLLIWFGILLCSLTSSLSGHADFAVRDFRCVLISAEAQLR